LRPVDHFEHQLTPIDKPDLNLAGWLQFPGVHQPVHLNFGQSPEVLLQPLRQGFILLAKGIDKGGKRFFLLGV
jgi:hypothetical protein